MMKRESKYKARNSAHTDSLMKGGYYYSYLSISYKHLGIILSYLLLQTSLYPINQN